jgi:hypothetical protein
VGGFWFWIWTLYRTSCHCANQLQNSGCSIVRILFTRSVSLSRVTQVSDFCELEYIQGHLNINKLLPYCDPTVLKSRTSELPSRLLPGTPCLLVCLVEENALRNLTNICFIFCINPTYIYDSISPSHQIFIKIYLAEIFLALMCPSLFLRWLSVLWNNFHLTQSKGNYFCADSISALRADLRRHWFSISASGCFKATQVCYRLSARLYHIETKANESFDNGVFDTKQIIFEAKRTHSIEQKYFQSEVNTPIVRKLFSKQSEQVRQ